MLTDYGHLILLPLFFAKKILLFVCRLFDPSLRTFDARLGPSGGKKGYAGMTGLPSSGLAWSINGYMAPELYLRRGLTYAFRYKYYAR